MRDNKIKKLAFKYLPPIGGVVGIFVVMFGLIIMNGLEGPKKGNKDLNKTSFDINPAAKKNKPKPKVAQKKKIKKSRPKIAPPSLAGALGGSSFGLGQFEFLAEGAEGLLGHAGDVVMTEDTVDEVPRATYRPPLKYPDYARDRGINGEVILNILVDKTGAVEQVKLLASNPSGIFDDVAMDSVRGWQFDPATYKGGTVKVWVKQKISFNLN
jgi:periplasmic protein TonB